MALEVLISESEDKVEATIFSRKGNEYVDVQFVILARYGGSEGKELLDILCFQEEGGAQVSPIFHYYASFEDECGIRKLATGIYRLVLPKCAADGKQLQELEVVGSAGIVLKKIEVGRVRGHS